MNGSFPSIPIQGGAANNAADPFFSSFLKHLDNEGLEALVTAVVNELQTRPAMFSSFLNRIRSLQAVVRPQPVPPLPPPKKPKLTFEDLDTVFRTLAKTSCSRLFCGSCFGKAFSDAAVDKAFADTRHFLEKVDVFSNREILIPVCSDGHWILLVILLQKSFVDVDKFCLLFFSPIPSVKPPVRKTRLWLSDAWRASSRPIPGDNGGVLSQFCDSSFHAFFISNFFDSVALDFSGEIDFIIKVSRLFASHCPNRVSGFNREWFNSMI